MLKEIGSDFWLNRFQILPQGKISFDSFGYKYSDAALFSSGRGAIAYILEHIKKKVIIKKVLLPSYTCATVIEPFARNGYELLFYDINKQFECDPLDFQNTVLRQQPDIILVHSYFGFDTLSGLTPIALELRENGAIIINDVTHALYSEFTDLHADYFIGSLRKWAPLLDGGFALKSNGLFGAKPERIDLAYREAKLKALHTKYLYIVKNRGKKEQFRRLYKYAEELLSKQSKFFTMTDESRYIQANLDLCTLRSKRRTNYQNLLDVIGEEDLMEKVVEPVFKYLPKGVTPLYFPVYVKGNRSNLQRFLAKQNIYCPIIWPKSNLIPSDISESVNWLYEHILAIPCDQRYGSADMQRIGEVVATLQCDDAE